MLTDIAENQGWDIDSRCWVSQPHFQILIMLTLNLIFLD